MVLICAYGEALCRNLIYDIKKYIISEHLTCIYIYINKKEIKQSYKYKKKLNKNFINPTNQTIFRKIHWNSYKIQKYGFIPRCTTRYHKRRLFMDQKMYFNDPILFLFNCNGLKRNVNIPLHWSLWKYIDSTKYFIKMQM